jgi:hypothetical protein
MILRVDGTLERFQEKRRLGEWGQVRILLTFRTIGQSLRDWHLDFDADFTSLGETRLRVFPNCLIEN